MRWHGPDWSLPVGSALGHGVRKSSLIHLGTSSFFFFWLRLSLFLSILGL